MSMGPLMVALACSAPQGDTAQTATVETFADEDLGTIAAGEPLTFTVPEGASAALVHCGPAAGELSVAELRGPSWSYTAGVTGGGVTGGGVTEGIRFDPVDEHLGVLLPQSPEHPLEAGAWELTISGSGEIPCAAVYGLRLGPAEGTLELSVVASEATDTSGVAEAVTAASGVLETAGVSLVVAESLTYTDVTTDVTGASVTPSERWYLPISVEEELTDDGRTIQVAGPGTPGLPGVHGAARSGLTISATEAAGDPDRTGLALAHEIAHFFGLFHTTAEDGSAHDVLEDTPECSVDADGNGLLTADECSGRGDDNLMFWSLDSDTRGLTTDQIFVLQHGLTLR